MYTFALYDPFGTSRTKVPSGVKLKSRRSASEVLRSRAWIVPASQPKPAAAEKPVVAVTAL